MYKHIHTHIYMSIHIFTYSYISIVSIHTYPLYPFIHIHCLHTYIYAYVHTYIHILFAFHWVLKPHEWHAYFAIPSATSPSNDLSRSFWCIPHCLTPWELFVMQPIHPCLLFLGTALISPLLRFAQVTDWSRNRTDISTYYGIAFCPLIISHSPNSILRACWMATQDRVVVVVISCWPEQVHIPNDVEVPVAKWS